MPCRNLHRDIETRSALDLKVVGAARYAADPTTDVWCVAFAVDDGPVQIWYRSEPIPEVFFEAARNPEWIVVAHNDAFERAIEENILAARYGWPLVPIDRHRCTMAMAQAAALPAGLDRLAEALELPIRKDKEGARLMLQMAKPRKPRAGEDPNIYHWHDEPEKIERLGAYCQRDVEVERAAAKHLPPLIDAEQKLWTLDAIINARGFHVDTPLLEASRQVVTMTEAALQAEFRELTGLDSTNQVDKLVAWLGEKGCAVTDVQKSTLRHALRRKGLDPIVRRAIELRLQLAHASAAKIDALLAWRNADGRVRGSLQFHAASTGRWAGRGPQPQNFKRDGEDIDAKIEAIMAGGAGLASPVEAVGDIARAMICAASGCRLLIGDFSGIESRVLAWISGQQSKLDQWAKFDHTGLPDDDPYVVIGRSFGHSEEKARASGKIGDLAFGYQGGVGAWQNFAPEDDASDEATIKRYRDKWRADHPRTVQFWYSIDRAAIAAVRHPNMDQCVGRLTFRFAPPFLCITLPSGRALRYPFPRIETGRFDRSCVIYKDASGGKWTDCNFGGGAYGGLWAENIVSGVARDLLAAAMQRLDAAGYPVVLHVHDEIVAEVPNDFGSLEEFKRLLIEAPDWAAGLPIAAKVREGQRFSKPSGSEPAAAAIVIPDALEALLDGPAKSQDAAGDGDDGGDPVDGGSPGGTAGLGLPAVSEPSPMPILTWDKIHAAFERKAKPDATSGQVNGKGAAGNGHDLGNGQDLHAGKQPIGAQAWPPLADLIGRPLINGKCNCPFHDDLTPSCHVYSDHFHCYGCGVRGDPLEWLMWVEGATYEAARHTLENWSGPRGPIDAGKDEKAARTRELSARLWNAALPVAGTLAERYLTKTRRLDISLLPDINAVLRFHPACPFGGDSRHPCLIALFRDVVTDEPAGIHRIALTADAQKVDRMMLGSWSAPRAIKLWPAGRTLAVGEGIETTLAASTRYWIRNAPLHPAWAMGSKSNLESLPLLASVEQLVVLSDNDASDQGQAAARACALTWQQAGREVVLLTPKQVDSDFNDLIPEDLPC